MRKILVSVFICLFSLQALAQTPEKMSYQAVVRDNANLLVADKVVGMRISILQGSVSGTADYVEIQRPQTNVNGLVTLEIGAGTVVAGSFAGLNWSEGPYFIQTEIDPSGGSNYSILGVSQLLSVPYALYAKTSGSSTPGPAGPQGPKGNQGEVGPQGPIGLKGDQGATGPPGPKGEQGLQGENGLQGPQGIAGRDGVNGMDGAVGLQGPKGEQGIEGLKGDQGPQGSKGDKGDQGEVGPQGPIGLKGEQGATGPPGPKGEQGLQGENGLQGPQGIAGRDGVNGMDGAVGLQGPKGEQGIEGLKGDQGPQGSKGDKGDQGEVGPQGPIGLKGEQGATGPPGPKGEQGEAGGPPGPMGLKGEQGATGPPGPKGDQGEMGVPGKSLYELALDLGFVGTEFEFIASLAGPQGIAGRDGVNGMDGAVGPQGPQGEQGFEGPKGEQGPQGFKGDKGDQGEIGPLGPKGDQGEVGLQGIKGEKGDQGAQGIDGAIGPQGPQGPQGLRGENGLQGPRGIAGTDGINGIDGAAGPQGPKGDQGEVGPQGPIGLKGDQGIQGPQGNAGPAGQGGITQSQNVNNITVIGNGTIVEPYLINISEARINEISANTLKVGFTDALVENNAAVAANTAKVGLTNGAAAGDMLYWDGSAWIRIAAGFDGQTLTFYKGVPVWIGNTKQSYSNTVLNPTTGKIWMDRNLGATRVAISSSDASAYGDLYQWGRGADGHQSRTSGTTATLSNSDKPGNSNFILAPNSPYDWRTSQNINFWQGVAGINNPCPTGYRIPTEAEWNDERLSWSANTSIGAFTSPLKLPMAGYRRSSNGFLYSVGSSGEYWSSTVSGSDSRQLIFSSNDASMFTYHRASGYSVRCIKDY